MKTNKHVHTWIITSTLIALAIISILFMPADENYSVFFFGLAGAHLMIALIAIFTGWILFPQKIINKIWKRKKVEGFDFGWAPKWLYAFVFASILVLIVAVHLFFSIEGSFLFRLLVYTLLLLISFNLFSGFLILQNSKRQEQLTLPMTSVLPSGKGLVLDAGCGAGRTTIAFAAVTPHAELMAFDKFDADYIEGGGMELLKKNLDIAGISDRVFIHKGDITATGFEDHRFDAIISSYMYDHLGSQKQKALEESFRILKPGGRFLLIIVVRNYSTFVIANLFCFLLPTRSKWKKWITNNGFRMISDGNINEGAYFCFEKPD